MSLSRARLAGWGLWLLSLGITVVTMTLVWFNRATEAEPWFIALAVLFILGYVTVGAAIVARLPSNPIGWLFIAVGLGFLLGGLADEWVTYAVITEPGALFGVDFFVWLSSWVSMAAALIPLIFILFPDGHPPSRHWRPVVVLLAAGIGVGALTSMVSPGAPEFGGVPIEKAWVLPFLDGLPGFVLSSGSAMAIGVGGLAR